MADKQPAPGARSRSKRILQVSVALLVALIVLEVGARVWLVHFAAEPSFRRYATFSQLRARYGKELQGLRDAQSLISHAHHRYLGYFPTPNYRRGANRHNALGYRGEEIVQPKPAGEFRIVCLGGSTTYSAAVEDYRQAYPYLLQQELRGNGFATVTVVNAGTPGWSSWESLINLQIRVLDLDPDMIVVLHGINDASARLVWPPESYRGDNSGRRRPNASGLFMPGVWEYSTVLRWFLVRSGRVLPHSAQSRTVDPPAETYFGDDFLDQHMKGTYPSGPFLQADAAEMLRRNPPVYFARNIEQMVLTARARSIVPLLLTFNSSPDFDRAPRTNTPEYIAAYEEMNGLVRSIAGASGAHLVDLAERLPRDRRYYADGHHMTPEGSLLKAKLIARYIIENDLLPTGSRR